MVLKWHIFSTRLEQQPCLLLPQFSSLVGSNLLHIPSLASTTTAPQVLPNLLSSKQISVTSSPYCTLSWRETTASKKNSDVAHISYEMVGRFLGEWSTEKEPFPCDRNPPFSKIQLNCKGCNPFLVKMPRHKHLSYVFMNLWDGLLRTPQPAVIETFEQTEAFQRLQYRHTLVSWERSRRTSQGRE